jgi:hypothetical protein
VGSASVLFLPSSVKEQNAHAEKMKKTTAMRDRARLSHLQKSLDLLDQIHEEKDLFLQKTR